MSAFIPFAKLFVPSAYQAKFFQWVETGTGSAVLIAVAGSGKSTTIIRALAFIAEATSVVVCAFNTDIIPDLEGKLAELRTETGRKFSNVTIKTFHSLGMGALMTLLGSSAKVDKLKLRKLFEYGLIDAFGETEGRVKYEMYSSFCTKLVSYAKGEGVGILCPKSDETFNRLIDHHDMELDHQDANMTDAIKYASVLLDESNELARREKIIDFDDMLYLPLLWKLKLRTREWVIVDEGQDTNPVRRAFAKLLLVAGGRLAVVGDPGQAIYGFTGASHDALDLIKEEFSAITLPLTVSYRCPKAIGVLARELVPHFEVHEDAIEGSVVRDVSVAEIAKTMTKTDAILCRNTKPLVSLAYQLLAKGIACQVLGSDIGKGLTDLIRKMRAQTIDGLVKKLNEYEEREVASHMAKGEESRAEAVTDRVECVRVFIANLDEKSRTIAKLIAKIQSLFVDPSYDPVTKKQEKFLKVLTLSTIHKSKGKEWDQVAILEPQLMPSKWARQEWQMGQEKNLMYVAITRSRKNLFFMAEMNPKAEKEIA